MKCKEPKKHSPTFSQIANGFTREKVKHLNPAIRDRIQKNSQNRNRWILLCIQSDEYS